MNDDYEDIISAALPSAPTPRRHKNLDYRKLYQDVGAKYGLDPDLLYNQAKQESANFNPYYVHGPGRSPKGAAGVAQFMPDTARQYGLQVGKGRDDRFDPYKAADAQARLMKDLIGRYGDHRLALAAYNSGTNKTARQAQRAMERIPETRGYVAKIAPQQQMADYDDVIKAAISTEQSLPKQPISKRSGKSPKIPVTPARQTVPSKVPEVVDAGNSVEIDPDTMQPIPAPSMQARQPGFIERLREKVSPYVPGLASIDTPSGIKTDVIRGAISGLTLGALGDRREISREEKLLDPQAEQRAETARTVGEAAPAVVPYLAAAKVLRAAPVLGRAGRVASAARTGLTFGGVEAAREGIRAAKTGESVRPTEVAVSTAVGAAMGAIPGANPKWKSIVTAAVLPQATADYARGVPLEQAVQNAVANLLFAGFDLAGRGDSARARREHVQQRLSELQGEFGERAPESMVEQARVRRRMEQERANESQTEIQPPVEAQREAVEPRPTVAEMGQRGVAVPQRPEMVSPESRTADTQLSTESARPVDTSEVPALPSEVSRAGVRDPARFYHRDYGEVTESPNQRKVGKGRVRVVGEDGKEHVIKRADMSGRGNQRAVPVRESSTTADVESKRVTPESLPEVPESSTSAKKVELAADRAELDLPELPPAERKSWQQSLNEAKPENATRLADEVLNRPRALSDSETASLVVRAQQVKNEHAAKLREIGEATDESTISARRNELETLEREFDQLTQAARLSGTEKGRTLAAQKLTINQDYDLISLVQRAKAAKGRELTPDERSRYEQQSKQIADLEAKLTEASDRNAKREFQKQVDRIARRERRTQSKQSLDEEFVQLKQQFAQARAETRSVQPGGLAGIDPEGRLTKLIGQMARNRIRAGVTDAAQLVDDVHAAISEHIEGLSKRDVRDAISGYGRASEPRGQSELQRIQSELKKLSTSEDITTGKRLSPRDKARQTQLRKQEAEIQRRMAERDFAPTVKPEPPPYTRETVDLQRQVDALKQQFNRELYKATRSRGGKITDTLAAAANVPKTLKSMGDISAVFRQGGYYSVTHPIKGLAVPFRDMVRSFSDAGYRNVEQAIKSHPKFEQAKRDGVEFTGVDKDDPRLSHREEGYLGSDVIDTLSQGRVNPLRAVKGIKDLSERTFVSFLDSQRMSMYDTLTEGLTNPSMISRLLGAKGGRSEVELVRDRKRIAKAINSATGRGNLGVKGNQAAPLLNVVMFSPRLLKSRVELLNNTFNPVAIANMPRNARAEIVKDNAKFLAATVGLLGLAKALGAQVNYTNPDEGDFLKIRIGNTTYDTLTGLQQPMRYLINMGRAMGGYSDANKMDLTARFARSKLSPIAGAGTDYLYGRDFLGRPFSLKREAGELITPLPASDVIEAMQQEGLIGGAKALPTLTGIGVATYPKRPPSSREQRGSFTERLRKGTISEADVEDARQMGQLTKADADRIKREGGITARQAEFTNKPNARALDYYEHLSPAQQEHVREIMERKAWSLVNSDSLTEAEKEKNRARLEALGIEIKRPRNPLNRRDSLAAPF